MLYLCQVPGCGVKIKRPWNHVNQAGKHKNLSATEKHMYTMLTKQSCCVVEESAGSDGASAGSVTGATGGTGDCVGVGDKSNSGESSGEVARVVSTGRQRYGDTRSMPFFPLTTKDLVDFMQ